MYHFTINKPEFIMCCGVHMLKIYTGNKLENLLEKMNTNIRSESRSPLEKTPVCIQTPGMQRWTGLESARLSGISANLDFVFPGALMKRLAGVKAGAKSPWPEKQELVWMVFEQLCSLPEDPVFQTLRSYMSNDDSLIKTYRLANRIADVFDQYQIYRKNMVLGWLKPKPENLPDQKDLWQVELFRRLFTDRTKCKTFIFDRFIKDCLRGRAETLKNMPAIHIFGISVIPFFFIEMLKAVSAYTDVNFYLLSPTSQYWGDSKTVKEIRRKEKYHQKTAKELYLQQNHELLDNLGVIGRDFFDYIYGSDDSFEPYEEYYDIDKKTVLSTVQSEILTFDIGNNERDADGSITVNSCHNPLREVEVLYDQLLDVFGKIPDLKPSDILVMTPDIEKYAPYIRAVFDNPYSGKETIPYSVADISERQSNRPAGIFMEVLDTVRGDFSVSEVFKILSYDIVADKFGISRADINTLGSVFSGAGACWAHSRNHLEKEELPITDIFTWKRALQRIALGLAEGSTRAVYADASAENVPFSMAEEIGGVMDFADKSAYYADLFNGRETVSVWCSVLQQMSEDFLSPSPEFADDLIYLESCLKTMNEESAYIDNDIKIPPEPVILRLRELLSESRGAKGFMSGRVTFCAMLPMRSIPFRVIAVIGLNENTFPRQKSVLEFDLIANKPEPGDRDNRDSDRYLFLETLISAREKLILSYVGQSEKNNSELPPSTLVTELSAHLKNRFGIDRLERKHKLHSFSRDYFRGEKLFTYSKARFEASKAFGEKKKERIFAADPLDTEEIKEISLAAFEAFFIDPSEFYLKNILGIDLRLYTESLPETEILTMDSLQNYSMVNSAISENLKKGNSEELLEYCYQAALLPPENLGRYCIGNIAAKASGISSKAKEILGGEPESRNISAEIDGLSISGSIEGVRGGRHIYIKPGQAKPKDVIRCLLRHLLLNTQSPTTSYILSGRTLIKMEPAGNENIKELVSLFRKGCRFPLRFHISDTEGVKSLKGITEDTFSNKSKSRPYALCFGDADTDTETADIISRQIKYSVRGGS